VPDTDVLHNAVSNQAILLTEDKDFGEMVFRDSLTMHGIALIRLAGLPASRKAAIVSRALRDHEHELVGNFTVITPNSIRIRRRQATFDASDQP
jgi:predicted nuclease of predicted toxin-antitoxin system